MTISTQPPADGADLSPWIMSRRADFWAFVAPGWLSVAVALFLLQLPTSEELDLWIWVLAVLAIDVAHVWASLYRSYADPQTRKRWGLRLWFFPVAVGITAFVLHHFGGSALFWRVLAYIAVFHFIQQHIGFLAIYQRKVALTRYSKQLARWTIWCNTAGAILWWHTQSPRAYQWFTPHDFVHIPYPWVGRLALAAGIIALLAFVVDQLQHYKHGRFHPMIAALVLTPALTWQLGIVLTNDDRAFTLTNVVLHGIPYIVLSFVAGGWDTLEHHLQSPAHTHEKPRPYNASPLGKAILFYIPLLVLAFGEEFFWDICCWGDHPQIFGQWGEPTTGLVRSVAVSLLVIPQATHYVLDRYIWRQGPRYPHLARQLGL